MDLNDEVLGAWLDGELDPARCAEVERALAADPGARVRVERLRQADQALRAALPARSGDHFAAAMTARIRGDATPRPMRQARWPWAAAACAAGLLIGYVLPRPGAAPPADEVASVLLPGSWQQMFDATPAGATAGNTQLLLSFRAADGRYCRLFRAGGAAMGEGLACRTGDRWQLAAWDASVQSAEAGSFRAAGASALIDSAMAELGGTPAFDEAEERALIDAGWRAR